MRIVSLFVWNAGEKKTLSMLGKIFSRRHLFFPENKLRHGMQVCVSFGDNLHEMSKPVFWEKYRQSVVCWIFPESNKG